MIVPPFEPGRLQAICDAIAETSVGLTGSEIGMLLRNSGIPDPEPSMTKRHRLFAALNARQQQERSGSAVVLFLQQAMDPARYVGAGDQFNFRLEQLNAILSFDGYVIGKDGKARQRTATRTLDEAEDRATKLATELRRRGAHPDVLRFCQAQLLQDNYFHAVLEATKSVAEKIRAKSGLMSDGAELAQAAFGGANPRLAINSLQTDTERSEQRGFVNMLIGVFDVFRNPTAHAPRITWPIREQDAFDLLSMVSYLHRRLDDAVTTSPGPISGGSG